jgi:hypothetical protein
LSRRLSAAWLIAVIAFLTQVRDFDKRWRGSIQADFSTQLDGQETRFLLKKLLERFERLERLEPTFAEAQHAESFTVNSVLVAVGFHRARADALLSR